MGTRARGGASPALMVARGLVRRCPNCGGGKLFANWLTMKERCPTCGMKFEREEGFFLGAFVMNFGLVLFLLALWVLVGVIALQPDPPVVLLSVLGVAGSAAVATTFYPASRTVWSAIDLIMHPLEQPELDEARASVRHAQDQ